MPEKRLLVSWIGHNDLKATASSLPASKQASFLQGIGDGKSVSGDGPIGTLLKAESFDEVHLISDFNKHHNDVFKSRVEPNAHLHKVDRGDPTDYARIFKIVDKVLSDITSKLSGDYEICFHLSSGTPAMASIWLLLSQSRYPAKLYQTHRGRAWLTEIPFDIRVDFIPEVLRQRDLNLQHLAELAPSEVEGFEQIVGRSKAIREATGRAKRAADFDVPVLILGESGTGKELFARAIHNAGPRRNGPYEAINCAAIPKELLESELFGAEKGAFSGATQARKGAFERAHEGTLFLDELGDLSPEHQVKILRTLEDGEVRRVGGQNARKVDVRIIAATNRDLGQAIADGDFRGDLFYRLGVITIKLPPLRHRRDDIPILAKALLERVNERLGKGAKGAYQDKRISPGTMEFVKQRDWPGNVRELLNVLTQAAIMSNSHTLQKADFAAAIAEMPGQTKMDAMEQPIGDGFRLEDHLQTIQKHYLARAMETAHGVKSKAASLLGYKNYQTLDAQLKRLDVNYDKD